jgi:mRNA interferase RelE/StbE
MVSSKGWQFKLTADAEKQFNKLDKEVQKRIVEFFKNRLLTLDHPRLLGKALSCQLSCYWSYRIDDYRIFADIQDENLTIIAVSVGHRREIYH